MVIHSLKLTITITLKYMLVGLRNFGQKSEIIVQKKFKTESVLKTKLFYFSTPISSEDPYRRPFLILLFKKKVEEVFFP